MSTETPAVFKTAMSDRAATIYAALWSIGFFPACAGAYWGSPWAKWCGLVLMAPFSLYVALMALLGTISFVRALMHARS